jgi:hypothetical protein
MRFTKDISKNIQVYIASPYTSGDVMYNVKFQQDVFNELLKFGFFPISPLHIHLQQIAYPTLSYEFWMQLDKIHVFKSDCLLRLGGKSDGADREVIWATEWGKPVFYSTEELVEHYKEYFSQLEMIEIE